MNFEKFFKLISYAVVGGGFLSLWITGGFGLVITVIFTALMILAWNLEETKWQISERLGTVLVVVAVPIFYLGWKFRVLGFAESEAATAGLLARLILSLNAVKLLQKKSDRDWIFLYLMSFFEVLLAAGLSISPLYLATFILYLFLIVCAVIAFEIRKTSSRLGEKNTEKAKILNNGISDRPVLKRLPTIAVFLIFLIVAIAAPMFFMLPRVGGAGFGNNFAGLSTMTGFSDAVRLGAIGRIQQSDEVVMRVRLENKDGQSLAGLRWRGIALDTFDNRNWTSSKPRPENIKKGEKDYIQVNTPSGKTALLAQTVYLEPMDSPVLFALSRPILVQGNFDALNTTSDDTLRFERKPFERLSYKVLSDRYLPPLENLRNDGRDYSDDEKDRYLQLPFKQDERIAGLAAQIIKEADAQNRYDKAKAVEQFLQTKFGYTLEQKAGGDKPLSDFLFNVKEGHCEYFATAMAVMLRTQGIATRVVNGFQTGEYNETADVYVVRQKNAHSWVEVYFPKEKAWVPFDPTPFAGQENSFAAGGIFSSLNKYIEALETFWVQYFVAYDNQEQRSLFSSIRSGFSDFQEKLSGWLSDFQAKVQDWWAEVRGDRGFQASAWAVASGTGYLLLFIAGFLAVQWLYRRIKKLELWTRLFEWWMHKKQKSIVEFYERMQKILANKGFQRESYQTPLEFAFALNMPEAVSVTEKYNRVRFGEKNLTETETREIENWLESLENKVVQNP